MSSSRGDGGDGSDEDEGEQDRDDSYDEDEEDEGNEEEREEVEFADEGLEYNLGTVVYPINLTSAPNKRKSWKENHYKAFHDAHDLKQFS